jgi:predicted RNA binding protein YcfA (HicA-like mRNA interferase family)
VNGKQVLQKLKANGWSLDRVKGSHHIMTKAGNICPVPVHGTHDIPAGTLSKISKISGIKLP